MSQGSPSSALSTQAIAARLAPFDVQLAENQLAAIQTYVDLLLLWNHKVNLTSIEDPLEIVARHFGESIFHGKDLFLSACRLADAGSGAGFPGLALKIAFPQLQVVLIEPNLKKCAFLTEVIGALALSDVEIFRSQYANFQSEHDNPGDRLDCICSRALGDYKSLLRWAKLALKPDGRVILWLGEEDALLLSRTKGWIWELPIRIPESRRRVICVARPAQ